MRYQEDHGPPLFTYAALAAYLAIFGAQYMSAGGITHLFAFPWRVSEGQTWRLITATFLHGGLIHLAFNASMFYRFMPVIENWLGPWVATAMYAFLAVGSMGAEALVTDPRAPWGAIGASGVVYGLFGFLWVVRRRRDDAAAVVPNTVVQTLLAWLVICFLANFFGSNIANTAHLAGLLLGWMLGQAVVAPRAWRWPIFAGAVVLCGLIGLATWGPAWYATLDKVPVLRNRYLSHLLWPTYLREAFENLDPRVYRRPGVFM